jgi:hypothetical protein
MGSVTGCGDYRRRRSRRPDVRFVGCLLKRDYIPVTLQGYILCFCLVRREGFVAY